MNHTTPHIVILGAGFAALKAARELRRQAPHASIRIVSPSLTFVYLPSLIWIPTGLRQGADLSLPLQPFLDKHRLQHTQASVTGLRDGGRIVQTDHGEIHNDALIIATGGRFIKQLPGIEHALTLCEGISAAETIGQRLRQMAGGRIAFGFGGNPQEPSAMRGGPMFELLFGVDTWLRQQGKRQSFELTFFNPAAQPGQRLGAKAVAGLLAEMQRRNIHTHLGHKLKSLSANAVHTEGGQVPADLILFMPGLTGPQWAEASGLARSAGGFFQADEYCRVVGSERVFVAGDAGSYPGPDWLPKQAHMAEIQARAAADNLLRALAGQPPHTRADAELACIVDSGNKGMLVYRNAQRTLALPASRLFHWAKRAFERQYLRQLR